VKNHIDLKRELLYFKVVDKAKEIYQELGDKAALSDIKSTHKLLHEEYLPDMDPKSNEKPRRFRSDQIGPVI